jgi:hypothetical protein
MPYDPDDDDRPRARRRSRRGRKRGLGTGAWVASGSVMVVLVVVVVVAVVIARKGGGGGTGGGDQVAKIFTDRPGGSAITAGACKITSEEFAAIKAEDTLATLEARFGPAKRFGTAELEGMDWIITSRVNPKAEMRISFARSLRDTWQITNPECYHWSGGGTDVYVIPVHGHPTAGIQLKYYIRKGANELSWANLIDRPIPPLPPIGK